MESSNDTYGPHLTLEGFCDKRNRLANMGTIYDFLHDLPSRIGMTRWSLPDVKKSQWKSAKDDWGVSGICLIIESHIALHTYPSKMFVFLDIFSCKDFDVATTQGYVNDFFGVRPAPESKWTLATRGFHFPKDINISRRHWSGKKKDALDSMSHLPSGYQRSPTL